MKIKNTLFLALFFLTLVCCNTNKTNTNNDTANKIDFVQHENENKIDVLVNNQLFTSLQWPDDVYKPVLYPVYNSSGTEITRGFPLQPKPGERPDHRHHVGNWLNYGNVNGSDFWGNGHSGERSRNGGEIVHTAVEKMQAEKNKAVLVTHGEWRDSTGNMVLSEKTEYRFVVMDTIRIIDRTTTLTALDFAVSMPDTKEGMFAIRVARQLELPSDGAVTVLNQNLEPLRIDTAYNHGISGNYISSEGISGAEVWGTRAKWMHLFGNIDDEKISVVICDHPENLNFPTYWHARGYGLFAANPLGEYDFTNKASQLNFSLDAGETLTFKYRLAISSGFHFKPAQIDALFEEFSSKE